MSLTFYQFAPALHALLRSTNLLKRFFRKFRTKADEIGVFPNELTCLTLFHLIVVRDHTKHDLRKVAETRLHYHIRYVFLYYKTFCFF